MTQKQRLLTVLMTLLLSVTCAWALDGSGTNSDPYQLGSVQDWKDFAAIVNNGTNPAANAKMTADIDLGTKITGSVLLIIFYVENLDVGSWGVKNDV